MASPMLSASGPPIKTVIREATTSCFKWNITETAGSRLKKDGDNANLISYDFHNLDTSIDFDSSPISFEGMFIV